VGKSAQTSAEDLIRHAAMMSILADVGEYSAQRDFPKRAKAFGVDVAKIVDAAAPPVRSCRVCGCTEDDCSGCVKKTGAPCTWVGKDLCSACRPAKTRSKKGR